MMKSVFLVRCSRGRVGRAQRTNLQRATGRMCLASSTLSEKDMNGHPEAGEARRGERPYCKVGHSIQGAPSICHGR
jgi:hypothetical protein